MTTTETPTAQAPPVPPHIIAMNETTAAVKALHRWLRNVLVVFLLLSALGGFIAWQSAQQASSNLDGYMTCIRNAADVEAMGRCS